MYAALEKLAASIFTLKE